MTLIENTYMQLKDAGLIATREEFSRTFVGKNPNWFAYQVHVGRDFSVDAAISCLLKIRSKLNEADGLRARQVKALARSEAQLMQRLNEHYHVADVCH